MALTFRTGLASATVACSLAATAPIAGSQTRTAVLSVPVRVVSASCTLGSPATSSLNLASVSVNCGGLPSTLQAPGATTTVGGVVAAASFSGAAAIGVLSTGSAVRGVYGSPVVSATAVPSGGPSGSPSIGPAGISEPASLDERPPAQGNWRGWYPKEQDPVGPLPVGAEPAVLPDAHLDTGPIYRFAGAADLPSQVSRIRLDGHVQMLVVF